MRTLMIAATLLVASATAAGAVCSQDQLTGSWALSGSDNAKWVHCTFEVTERGRYKGTCTGTGRPARGNKLDGTLRVDADCALTGTHRSGDQLRGQALIGDLAEDGQSGAGILKFGTRRQNFGNLFVITRKP